MNNKRPDFKNMENNARGYFGDDNYLNDADYCWKAIASRRGNPGCHKYFPLLKKIRGGCHSTRRS